MAAYNVIMTGATAPGFWSLFHLLPSNVQGHILTDYRTNMFVDSLGGCTITPDVTVLSSREEQRTYSEAMQRIVDKYNIDVVIPLRTGDVMALAEYPIRNAVSLIPTENPIKMIFLNDKARLLQFGQDLGIPVPFFTEFNCVEDFDNKAMDIIQQTKTTGEVVIKPKVQSGSRGMRIMPVAFPSEEKWRQFLEEKPAKNLRMSRMQLAATAGWKRNFELLMMEYLPGKEYTVDCLCYKGELVTIGTRLRTGMSGGISTGAKLVKDECYDTIWNSCEKIIETLELSYNVGFQFKCDENGVPKLIECNPRLQGTSCLTIFGGVDLIYYAIGLAMGDIRPRDIDFDINWGLELSRQYTEMYKDEGTSPFTPH